MAKKRKKQPRKRTPKIKKPLRKRRKSPVLKRGKRRKSPPVKRKRQLRKQPPAKRKRRKSAPVKVTRKRKRRKSASVKASRTRKRRKSLPRKPTASKYGLHTKHSRNKRPIPIDLAFLDNNNVPRNKYAAYRLPWAFHQFSGQNLVPIEADTLEKLCNEFRGRFGRGIQLGRLMINYTWKAGKRETSRTVGTARVFLSDNESWQSLLADYSNLVLTLYSYDADKFDDESEWEPKVYIDSVVLELLQIEDSGSIEIP